MPNITGIFLSELPQKNLLLFLTPVLPTYGFQEALAIPLHAGSIPITNLQHQAPTKKMAPHSASNMDLGH